MSLAALSQRRQMDFNRIQTEQQVFAKLSRLARSLKI